MAANQQTFTNWSGGYDPQGGESMPLLGPAPVFRNAKDMRLAAFGATPDTQHPDGYLGTLYSNRRQDKLGASSMRTNTRSYSRGVHKGERINQGDYLWPDEFNLTTGLANQAKGKKYAPAGMENPRLTNDGKAGPRGVPRGLDRPKVQSIDPERSSRLKTLAPPWK